MLYDSLRTKILTLPDDVEVWPAHGAGSACGRNISNESSSTIGIQRRLNWALQPMPREEFMRKLTDGLTPPPRYFPRDAELNRLGPRSLGGVGLPLLGPDEVRHDALILDVRDADAFGRRHIAGAINIGLDGNFASWSGTLLPFDAPIVIVADDETFASQAVMRLARVGIENVAGYIVAHRRFRHRIPSATHDSGAARCEARGARRSPARRVRGESHSRSAERTAGRASRTHQRNRSRTSAGRHLRRRVPFVHRLRPARACRLHEHDECAGRN